MLTIEARAKRNEYRRAWYAKNKEKARGYIDAYWERQAAKAESEEREQKDHEKE